MDLQLVIQRIQGLMRPRLRLLAVVVALVAALLPWLSGAWGVKLLASLATLAAVAAALLQARRAGRVEPAQAPAAEVAFVAAAESLEAEVTSVWVRNIELGRSQSEQALVDLSARFSGMVERLEEAVRAASLSADSVDSERGLQSMFEATQAELQSILDSLRQALRRSDMLFEQLDRLMNDVGQLRDLSGLVNSMAQQTKLVSLNAAVEAARAGEAGCAFSVVASEVRELATTSGDTSRQISRKIDAICESMESAFAAARASAEHSAFDRAEQGIVKVMDDVRSVTGGLKGAADLLRETSVDIRGEVAEALVLMQFQDRVSQILSHVRDNIQVFPRHLAEHEKAVAEGRRQAADWSDLRAALEGSYATAEEHRERADAAAAAGSDDDITFF